MLDCALRFFMTIKNKQELPQSVIIHIDQSRMIEIRESFVNKTKIIEDQGKRQTKAIKWSTKQ